jgi:amidase
MNEILALSAVEQARRVRDGSLGCVELATLYLDRIERHDAALSSFVSVFRGAALREAKKMDRAPREGRPAFHGVPIGIKDLNLVRGRFSKMGSRAYWFLLSPVDDLATAAIRRAGFVILGKLATSELGAMPVTEPDTHPPTRNPWNTDLTSGGSSGGSGTAVAAGLLPIAQGSDGAGSIRIPSSFCHLVGHKPSRGLLPNPYGKDDPCDGATVGPLARSVDDAAALLDAMVGRTEPPDEARAGSFFAASRRPPGRLRVRFSTHAPIADCDPEIAAAVHDVARRLAELGHEVDEGPTLDGRLEEFLPIWQRQVAAIPYVQESRVQPVTRWLREEGRRFEDAEIFALWTRLQARIRGWFGDADLWITPTVPVLPPRVGAWKELGPREAFERAATLGPFTALFNVTGQPAVSMPVGLSAAGVPIGVQLAGHVGADGRVLAVARQLEEVYGWTARHTRGAYR